MAEERKRLVITDVSGLRPLGITNVWTTFSCQHIQKLLGCLNQDQSGGTHKQSTLPLLKRGGWHFLKTKYIWIKLKELSTLWFGRCSEKSTEFQRHYAGLTSVLTKSRRPLCCRKGFVYIEQSCLFKLRQDTDKTLRFKFQMITAHPNQRYTTHTGGARNKL